VELILSSVSGHCDPLDETPSQNKVHIQKQQQTCNGKYRKEFG